MRLIDTATLRLVTKHDGDIPPYAILSHTWGSDEDEVSFQDIQELSSSRLRHHSGWSTHPVAKKVGFAKIRMSASIAKKQGYQYIWIDTCCIDKTSSAELSEAINSMFRWYRDSEVCYAFLNDVEFRGFEEYLEETLASVERSRWFTRGWTLQELIAPPDVEFYSASWDLIGKKNRSGFYADEERKDAFSLGISKITGVDLQVLAGQIDLQDLSIAERMKWAAHRQTTRIEDLAYSLLGIFNVNMPLLYGEGESAFIRLQEEILKASNDQSIFAWQCSPNDITRLHHAGLLAPNPSYFDVDFRVRRSRPLEEEESRESAPSTMTNAGLHVQFILMADASVGESEGDFKRYYALLDCRFHDERASLLRPAIMLTARGVDQFARINSDTIYEVPQAPSGKEAKYVYVKQVQPHVMPDVILDKGDVNVRIIQAYPELNWNKHTSVLKADKSRRTSVLGAFRYGLHDGSSAECIIDVFVGISFRQLDTPSWYCLQVDCLRTESLERVAELFDHRYLDETSNRLTSQCTHQGIVATARSSRQRNRTYIVLKLSRTHELHGESTEVLHPEHVLRPERAEHSELQTNPVIIRDQWSERLGHLFSTLVAQDSLETGLINYADNVAHLLPAKNAILVRTVAGPRSITQRTADTGQTFRQLLRVAASRDLVIGSPNFDHMDHFQEHFSRQLVEACIANDLEAVIELLDSRWSSALIEVKTSTNIDQPDSWDEVFRGFRPLHWAAALGYESVVKALLDRQANVHSTTSLGLTPIHLASMVGHYGTLEYLLKAAADAPTSVQPTIWPTERVPKPVFLAVSYVISENVGDIIRRLMTLETPEHSNGDLGFYSKPTNKHGETPLHRAAAMNNVYAIDAILSLGDLVNIEKEDLEKRTALWHAAASGSHEVIDTLLGHGADPNKTDSLGRTPLDAACRQGHVKAVERLLQAGAGSQISPTEGEITACHFAAFSGNVDVLRALQEHGADLDSFSHIGLAPIHIAAANGWKDCVELLYEAGCDIKRKANYGVVSSTRASNGVEGYTTPQCTPSQLASQNNHYGLSLYLQDKESQGDEKGVPNGV